jgi:paraquat-inducible protein B
VSAEARNFRVGLFVIAGMTLIAAFVVVLGGAALFDDPVLFETYFDESVQGLAVGSPVKVRGVQLGAVSAISFVQDDYALDTEEDRIRYGTLVRVEMNVQQATATRAGVDVERVQDNLRRLIGQGARLRLTSMGLTGTSFIEMDFLDAGANPPMQPPWEPIGIYIPSAPSTMKSLTSAAERIAAKLENVDVEKVVNDLDQLLISMEGKLDEIRFDEVQQGLDDLISEVRQTNAQVQRIITEAELGEMAQRAMSTLEQVDATVLMVERTVAAGRMGLGTTMDDLRVAAGNLRDVTETMRDHPSLLLFGEPPAPTEP